MHLFITNFIIIIIVVVVVIVIMVSIVITVVIIIVVVAAVVVIIIVSIVITVVIIIVVVVVIIIIIITMACKERGHCISPTSHHVETATTKINCESLQHTARVPYTSEKCSSVRKFGDKWKRSSRRLGK